MYFSALLALFSFSEFIGCSTFRCINTWKGDIPLTPLEVDISLPSVVSSQSLFNWCWLSHPASHIIHVCMVNILDPFLLPFCVFTSRSFPIACTWVLFLPIDWQCLLSSELLDPFAFTEHPNNASSHAPHLCYPYLLPLFLNSGIMHF